MALTSSIYMTVLGSSAWLKHCLEQQSEASRAPWPSCLVQPQLQAGWSLCDPSLSALFLPTRHGPDPQAEH